MFKMFVCFYHPHVLLIVCWMHVFHLLCFSSHELLRVHSKLSDQMLISLVFVTLCIITVSDRSEGSRLTFSSTGAQLNRHTTQS